MNRSVKNTGRFFLILFFFCLLLFGAWASLFYGAQKIDFSDGLNSFEKTIIFDLRLPRFLLALIAGSLLGGGGALFQLFFRNPLAESGILGISSGATFGAVLVSLFLPFSFLGLAGINLGAFAGALAAGLLVVFISGIRNSFSTVTLLLCGTALGTFFSAFSSILLSFNSDKLQSLYGWMLGSFSGRGWNEIRFILIPSFLAFILFMICAKDLDLLNGGELVAQSLGVRMRRLRILVLLAGSLATSCAVCAGGTIGFIGLIAPHIVRKFFGSKSKILIPLSMLLGAEILIFADIICRLVIAPSEIPVGIVTALIGSPFFILIIFSGRNSKK